MAKKGKAGRRPSEVWPYLSADPLAYKNSITSCKHCQCQVHHHSHPNRAINHLNLCPPFQHQVYENKIVRPDWFVGPKTTTVSAGLVVLGSHETEEADEELKEEKEPQKKKRKADQKTVTGFFPKVVQNLSEEEQQQFTENLAMFFYCSSISFLKVGDPHLKKAFEICRPNVVLPTRKELAGPLLNYHYTKVKTLTEAYLGSQTSLFALISDGWSNVNRQPVLHFMMVNPETSIFYKSVYTGEQSHSGEYLAQEAKQIIAERAGHFVGMVTDNAAANKKSWEILRAEFPDKYFFGCACHCINLVVRDIFVPTSAQLKRGDYPFEHLRVLTSECRELVSFFGSHHILQAKLQFRQAQAKGLVHLAPPVPTRWGSLQACFSSILLSDSVIRSVVMERDFLDVPNDQKPKREKILAIVSEHDFKKKLENALKILDPLCKMLKTFESDKIPLSQVFYEFTSIFKAMSSLEILQKEKDFLRDVIQARWDFIYNEAHGMSYRLDPRYFGCLLDSKSRNRIDGLILQSVPPADQNDIADQLDNFVISCRQQSMEDKDKGYQRLIENNRSVLTYWRVQGSDYPLLQKLALRLFTLPCSSSSCERSFSSTGLIHTKTRNKLGPATCEKLTYIHTNWPAISKPKFPRQSIV